ncbi:MAG: ABC transporter permease [Chloroflexi bacterium]|nr:ABC transporter permease [Chloroflexota bacterium]
MAAYLIRRLLQAIPVLFLVSVAVFSILYIVPGDPATLMTAETGASAEAIAKLRAELGLDQPAHVQYYRFISNAIRGDLGKSIYTGRSVKGEVLANLPATLELALAGALVAIIIGMISGIVAAIHQNTWVDAATMTVALFGISMPIFWSGLMLIFLLGVKLHWLPITGQGGLARLVMPALALGFASSGTTARLTRSSMLEVLRQEYMTTARAKGLRERTTIIRHGLRNALIPVVTMIGLQLGSLLGGTVIVETVFARQGLGAMTVNAIMFKDFPLVQGTILFSAVLYMAMNLLVDVLYTFIDPRIRVSAA